MVRGVCLCAWLGLDLGLAEPWALWDVATEGGGYPSLLEAAGGYCPSPRRYLFVPGCVWGVFWCGRWPVPLRWWSGLPWASSMSVGLSRVPGGSWAPGALFSARARVRGLWQDRLPVGSDSLTFLLLGQMCGLRSSAREFTWWCYSAEERCRWLCCS